MNNYIFSIPLSLSQQLVDYIDENGLDLEVVAEALESLVTEAYYEAEESDCVIGDLEDNVSVCVEGTDLGVA